MRVTFCGVGEAFDERLPNTCVHVRTPGASLLLDCGFSAAAAAVRHVDGLARHLDAVHISHFHGDHFFGLPALLGHLWDHRDRPLTIIGQAGVEQVVCQAVDLAYPGLRAQLSFTLEFTEAAPGHTLPLSDMHLRFARTAHSSKNPNLAVRVDGPGGPDASFFYSGDGRPTDESTALAQGCALAAHESYTLHDGTPGHGSVAASLAFARRAEVRTLALVHINKHVRRTQAGELNAMLAESGQDVLLPEPGHVVEFA